MSREQLADGHLSYVGSRAPEGIRSAVCYDVYPREGGLQLGYVWRTSDTWTAATGDLVTSATGRTRWEAVIALFGEAVR